MATLPSTIGRYRIVRLIGKGGMGAVYLAHDPAIDRAVAIKVLREDIEDDDRRNRFKREAMSAGRLAHRNIVTIFDVGDADGRPYIAMEYVEGRALADLIRQREPVPLATTLDWMEQLCEGLAHAHRAGIVHRDIKPGNLILDSNGVLKILDFGIARLGMSDSTSPGMVIGTLGHMSPEQVRGLAIDHRSDIFSVGVVFYELLSFERPFDADDLPATLHRILTEPPPALASLCPGLDRQVIAIVERALEKDPERRYQDLLEMRRDIAAARAALGERAAEVAVVRAAPPPRPAPPPAPTPPPSAGYALGRVDAADEEPSGPITSVIRASETVLAPGGAAPEPSDEPEREPAPDATMYIAAAKAGADAVAEFEPVLLVQDTPDLKQLGRQVPVTGDTFVIGRQADAGLALKDVSWSRQHARIEKREGGYWVVDLLSRNGTFVNDFPVGKEGTELPLGARIRIGSTSLVFMEAKRADLPDLVGRTLDGRYVLDRVLRENAKSVVYEAHGTGLWRSFAVKVLSPDRARSRPDRERFERDARVAKDLQHGHICRPLDFGWVDLGAFGGPPVKTPYLVADLLGGGTLADRLRAKDPLPAAAIDAWVGALGDALAYAHGAGVVHGDLKPSAVLFDTREQPYLTDFSQATGPEDEGVPAVFGTPAYMAPEQWRGGATPASDQFSLAAIAYYMLTGSPPFDGQEHPRIRRRNFELGPEPAHEEAARNRREAIPATVSDALRRALQADASARYPSVAEFARAFSAALRGESAGAAERRPAGPRGFWLTLRAYFARPQVFLSYHRASSSGWADLIEMRMTSHHRIDVFLDRHRLDAAGAFPSILEREIETCDVFVCLLGAGTLEQKWVRHEIEHAIRCGRPIIPVFCEGFKRPEAGREDPTIQHLIEQDGVNLYGEHSLEDIRRLARMVKNTFRGRQRRARAAGRPGG